MKTYPTKQLKVEASYSKVARCSQDGMGKPRFLNPEVPIINDKCGHVGKDVWNYYNADGKFYGRACCLFSLELEEVVSL